MKLDKFEKDIQIQNTCAQNEGKAFYLNFSYLKGVFLYLQV